MLPVLGGSEFGALGLRALEFKVGLGLGLGLFGFVGGPKNLHS